MKTLIAYLSFALISITLTIGYSRAETYFFSPDLRPLTKEQQAAQDKKDAENRAKAEAERLRQAAEKARMAAEREQLGLGAHREEEANEFLRMKREAEAERAKFEPYNPKPKESDCKLGENTDNLRTNLFLTKQAAQAALDSEVKPRLCMYFDGVKKTTNVSCITEAPSDYDLYEYDNSKKKIVKRDIPIKWRCEMTAICNKQTPVRCKSTSSGTAQ